MTSRRRPILTRSLILVALAGTGCAGGADDPATSNVSTSSIAAVTTAPDDFTEVRVGDELATSGTSAESAVLASDDTAGDAGETELDPGTASTSTIAASGSVPQTETNADGSVADVPDQTSPSASSTSTSTTTSTSSTTTTTVSARTPAESEQDRALAVAFTAQLDADDVEELGEVFDTACLGTEFVVAFGGAAAADAAYSLNLTTVTADSNLFNDEPLSEATAEAVVAALGRCGDFDDLVLLQQVIGPDEAELGRCILDAIPDGLLEASLVEDYQQIDGPALDAFDSAADDAFDTCFN